MYCKFIIQFRCLPFNHVSNQSLLLFYFTGYQLQENIILSDQAPIFNLIHTKKHNRKKTFQEISYHFVCDASLHIFFKIIKSFGIYFSPKRLIRKKTDNFNFSIKEPRG